uniref:Uncharacterized protein n=1 Tax=Nelumbo nucifera TaxID=4432 RepID=A0A822Z2J6_NELNU|nr:TPA_asm: hypothetical protein HUJ06_013232 [Nelumbo nucifera]
MSLLEVMKKTTVDSGTFTIQLKYSIILNADVIFLKGEHEKMYKTVENPQKAYKGGSLSLHRFSKRAPNLAKSSVMGFKSLGIQSSCFFKKLKRKLKNPKSLNQDEFLEILNLFLEKNSEKVGLSCHVDMTDSSYTCLMIEKLGFFFFSGLLFILLLVILMQSLIEKKRSDLLCLCVMHISNLWLPVLSILKYLSFSKLCLCVLHSVVSVRKEWESHALLAASKLGLKACQWVPSLKLVVKSLGLVLDDHFSSLVLYSEFHEELNSKCTTEFDMLLNRKCWSDMLLFIVFVKSLASEARICCSIANVLQNLIKDVGLCEGEKSELV